MVNPSDHYGMKDTIIAYQKLGAQQEKDRRETIARNQAKKQSTSTYGTGKKSLEAISQQIIATSDNESLCDKSEPVQQPAEQQVLKLEELLDCALNKMVEEHDFVLPLYNQQIAFEDKIINLSKKYIKAKDKRKVKSLKAKIKAEILNYFDNSEKLYNQLETEKSALILLAHYLRIF